MQSYTFIKYFPETNQVVKYFMGEKYNHIENISDYQNLFKKDPNYLVQINGGKWFEIYMPTIFVASHSHEDLAKLCECLIFPTPALPEHSICAIIHAQNKVSNVIWSNVEEIKNEHKDFVERYTKIYKDAQ